MQDQLVSVRKHTQIDYNFVGLKHPQLGLFLWFTFMSCVVGPEQPMLCRCFCFNQCLPTMLRHAVVQRTQLNQLPFYFIGLLVSNTFEHLWNLLKVQCKLGCWSQLGQLRINTIVFVWFSWVETIWHILTPAISRSIHVYKVVPPSYRFIKHGNYRYIYH